MSRSRKRDSKVDAKQTQISGKKTKQELESQKISRDWRDLSKIDVNVMVRTMNMSRSRKRDSKVDAKTDSDFRKRKWTRG